MAKREHLRKWKEDGAVWNAWRAKNPDIVPGLKDVDFRIVDLKEANPSPVNLLGVRLDTDSGKDLAVGLREYYIPDFSDWKDHDTCETKFAKLLRDLRATEK